MVFSWERCDDEEEESSDRDTIQQQEEAEQQHAQFQESTKELFNNNFEGFEEHGFTPGQIGRTAGLTPGHIGRTAARTV